MLLEQNLSTHKKQINRERPERWIFGREIKQQWRSWGRVERSDIGKGGLPNNSADKELTCSAGDRGLIPGLGRFSGEGKWQSTPIFLPEKSHGQRYLVGYSPKGCKELDMKAVYCHPAYLTYMQSTSWETLGWKKHKLNQNCWEKYQ